MGIQPEHLLALRLVGSPVPSADGQAMVFVEQWLNPEENRAETRIGELDPGDAEALLHVRWLTHGPSDRDPRPSPDGRHLGFLSRRSGESQVWLLPLSGGEPFQLTHIRGGVSEFVWCPDAGALIAVAALKDAVVEDEHETDPDDPRSRYTRDIKVIRRQYHKLDGTGFFGDRIKQLVEVSVPDGAVRVLTDGAADHTAPTVRRDGRAVAFVANLRPDADSRPSPADLHVLNRETLVLSTLTDGGLGVSGPCYSPDGRRLAFFANHPEDLGYGNTGLFVWEDGHLADWTAAFDRPLGDQSGSDAAVGGRTGPVWEPDGIAVRALVSHEGRVEVWRFDGVSAGHPLVSGDRVMASLAVGPGGETVGAWSDPVTPSALLWQTGDREQSWTWPVPWEPSDVARPVKIQARAEGGPAIDTWIMAPPQPRRGRQAVVLEVHGGPMSMYGERFFFEFQVLASAGMAVVYTNPRGSVGYGHAFCAAIMGQWGDKDYRDVLAGLDAALAREPSLDPERVGIAGGSYGGFMVNWAISHSHRFRAAVSMRSVVNRVSAMGSSDMGWLRIPQYGGHRWWENPEPYWQQSPLRYASAIETPVLLEHQEQDLRLPMEQAEQLFQALKVLGRDVTLVRYPGESHGMSRGGKPWHRVARLEMMVDWLRHHLEASGAP